MVYIEIEGKMVFAPFIRYCKGKKMLDPKQSSETFQQFRQRKENKGKPIDLLRNAWMEMNIGKTWPTKREYEKEFNEFRQSKGIRSESISEAKNTWFKTHLSDFGYAKYLERKETIFRKLGSRKMSRIRSHAKPKHH